MASVHHQAVRLDIRNLPLQGEENKGNCAILEQKLFWTGRGSFILDFECPSHKAELTCRNLNHPQAIKEKQRKCIAVIC